jgi:nucleotide-binding universal stress UspA family protein
MQAAQNENVDKTNSRSVTVTMDRGSLVVLLDGEPKDAALVAKARDFADSRGCPVTLLRVLPEVRNAHTDNGVVILPWQTMQLMEDNAKVELEALRARFLRGRAHANTKLVRFGRLQDELATVVGEQRAHAVLATSKQNSLLPWMKRDGRLQRKLNVPVLFLDSADQLVGPNGDGLPGPVIPLTSPDKIRAIGQVSAFTGMSRKQLQSIARNLDEARIDAGTTVIHEGRSNHALWIVVQGDLALTMRGRLIERISAPGLVGAPSMLDGRPAWATVTALTPVLALVASTEQFRAMCADERVAERLWAQTGTRLRNYLLNSMKVGTAG